MKLAESPIQSQRLRIFLKDKFINAGRYERFRAYIKENKIIELSNQVQHLDKKELNKSCGET